MLNNLKFLALFLINVILAILPTFTLRTLFLRLLGFKVGRDVTVHRGLRLAGIKSVSIGDFSTINHSVYLDNRVEIFIGKNVTLANNVKIHTLGHDINCSEFSTVGHTVRIGDDSVVFTGAAVMPGVSLAEKTVLYPYSLMTRDSKKREVWGGNPANPLRLREIKAVNYKATYRQWLGN